MKNDRTLERADRKDGKVAVGSVLCLVFRMRDGIIRKIAHWRKNDSFWRVGYYKRQKIVQINNNVQDNVIYFEPYIYQALSGQFTFCNFVKPCKGSVINHIWCRNWKWEMRSEFTQLLSGRARRSNPMSSPICSAHLISHSWPWHAGSHLRAFLHSFIFWNGLPPDLHISVFFII